MSRTVAFIPVRGGSKRILHKNIRIINGRPLVYWVIDAAVSSRRIERVYVSSDSKEIRKIVNEYGSDKVEAIDEAPTKHGNTENAMLQFAEKYTFNNVVLIQATSPLTTFKQLNDAVWFYLNNKMDSLCAVSPLKKFMWKQQKGNLIAPMSYNPAKRPLSQNWDGELVENGAFYITSHVQLTKSKCRVSGRIGAFVLPAHHLFEIDDFDDFVIMETLLKHYKGDHTCLK